MSVHASLQSTELVDFILGLVEKKATLFDLLGVPSGADSTIVKQAFVKLARLLHPDLPVFDTPEAKERATSAFQALTRAQLVLVDSVRRQEYMEGIGALQALSTSDDPNPDLARIHLHRGKQCAVKRDWPGAQANFERAIVLFGDRVDDMCRVELGWAIFQNKNVDEIERSEKSHELFQEVIAERGDPAAVAQAHYYMAVWCKLNDEVPVVKKHLERCLSINDKHVEARRELRLFERRRSSAAHKRVSGSIRKAQTKRLSRVTQKMSAPDIAAPEQTPGARPAVKKVPLKKKVSLLERLFGKN
ncbi:MAG TPA: hypothetical protein DCQ06_02625 [Myxococcales bacterium]|nr:hypothetical protein [Myxococcales bacterium]HAN30469.1 hypothetical protein [Myxococcales bacterium]